LIGKFEAPRRSLKIENCLIKARNLLRLIARLQRFQAALLIGGNLKTENGGTEPKNRLQLIGKLEGVPGFRRASRVRLG
jgi:hypothetical protein